jgi:ECF transporter S component (folate family)
MKKSQKNLRITVLLALMVAISILMGKYLAIRGGDVMRFSLENTPIILAGMAFGPGAGAAVGLIADIVGCIMVGYTINPIVALGGAAIGLISGLMPRLLRKIGLNSKIEMAITVATAHIIGSVIIKTIGLSAYYSMPFAILMLWRALNYLIVGILDGCAVHILLHNKAIDMQIKELTKK